MYYAMGKIYASEDKNCTKITECECERFISSSKKKNLIEEWEIQDWDFNFLSDLMYTYIRRKKNDGNNNMKQYANCITQSRMGYKTTHKNNTENFEN